MFPENQRLDKWLVYCRFVKSRKMAADLVIEGRVRINRTRVEKPAQTIKPGDVLTLSIRDEVRIIRVLAPANRRGPAREAQGLYECVTNPPEPC